MRQVLRQEFGGDCICVTVNQRRFFTAAEFFNCRFAFAGAAAIFVRLEQAESLRLTSSKIPRAGLAGAMLAPAALDVGGNAGIKLVVAAANNIHKPARRWLFNSGHRFNFTGFKAGNHAECLA